MIVYSCVHLFSFAQNSTESDEIDVRGGKGEGLRGGEVSTESDETEVRGADR